MTEHTCRQGPLCKLMTVFLDGPAEDVPECEHSSCIHMAYDPCGECNNARMEEAERQWQEYLLILPYLQKLLCPVDMTELDCRGVVAAPGYGTSFECHCGHYWLHASGTWYSERELQEYVPELTIWDVM